MDKHWKAYTLLFLSVFVTLLINGINSTTCTRLVTTRRSSQRSRTTGCGWWGRRCTRYFTVYNTAYTIETHCCSGWTGHVSSGCPIPVCDPPCQNNGVCYDVNECFCRRGTQGNTCAEPEICSFTNDCYPGSCERSTSACRCSSGFTGPSCTTIREGGTFTQCTANIPAVSQTSLAYEKDCLSTTGSSYTNNANVAGLELDWKVGWTFPEDTPNSPSYILESRPGIIASSTRAILKQADGTVITTRNEGCAGHDVSSSNPYPVVECRNIALALPNQQVEHMGKLEINFLSTTGGFKRVKNENTQEINTRTYAGRSHTESMEITFDLVKPEHCSQSSPPCSFEESPALGVYPDTTKFTTVRTQIHGWDDDGSGIQDYQLTLHHMEYNSNTGKLVMGNALRTETWDMEEHFPEFNVRNTGVYSIVMDVNDFAGNTVRARTIIFVDTQNNIEVSEGSGLRVNPSITGSQTGVWIPETGHLDVQWPNIFSNSYHVTNHFLAAVDTLHHQVLDDTNEGDGNRTINAIENVRGITHFEVGYRRQSQLSLTQLEAVSEHHMFSNVDRNDGDVIQFLVIAYDLAGHTKNATLEVRVDSSPPTINSEPLLHRNVESERDDMYYASRASIRMHDAHSGIAEITFSVFDTSEEEPELIHQEAQATSMLDGVSTSDCTNTGRCYCIADGQCYAYDQSVWIDNCWFVDQDTSSISLEYTAINNAGLQTSGSHDFGQLGRLDGIGYYPTPENIGTTRDRGDSIDVIWFLPPSCYPYSNIVITYKVGRQTNLATLDGPETRYTLQGLKADTEFELSMVVIFEDGTRRESDTYTFSTKPKERTNQESGLTAAGLAGIIVAAILFALLLATLIVMFVRYKRNKHPIPHLIRDTTTSIRHGISRRFSKHPTRYDSELESRTYDNNYVAPQNITSLSVAHADTTDDMYIYGTMETDANASWKYGGDRLKIKGHVPGAKGRFADIKYGILQAPDGQKKVVVKMNKAGASQEDRLLMTAKMNYLATQIDAHEFIVNMVGAIPPPKGPMILFENCDLGSLSDWLKKLVKVTGDNEEQMIMFTIHTAKGMQFLHEKGILHRRLGARNVLLQTDETTNQIRAKLSGFGPLKGEQEGGDNKHRRDRIPIKWMAPEQFNKPEGESRHYSKETDVWSFAITVWEIFSKGEAPYPEHPGVSDMKAAVLNGYRMKIPPDCPDFMHSEIMVACWNTEPQARSNFNTVVSKLESHYGSQGGDIYGYDPANPASQSDYYSSYLNSTAMQVD